MATSKDFDTSLNLTTCYVCLEPFKTPRYLPCSHTFCHTCLSTHIQSSCQKCDPPLGFSCPICRVFVPAPGEINRHPIQNWAKRFPENKLIASCVENHGTLTTIVCGPCETKDEKKMTAHHWCSECENALCEKCIENHKKYKALQLHYIFPLSNLAMKASPEILQTRECGKHEEWKLELVCNAHQSLCCALCIVQEHQRCGQFSTMTEAADKFSEENKLKLLQNIDQFSSKIDTLIEREKQNIADIDDKTDRHTEEIEKMSQEMITCLNELKEKHLHQLAKVSKEVKQKLEGSVETLEHRKLYLAHWKEILSSGSENQTKEEVVIKCLKLKKILQAMKQLPMFQMIFDMNVKVCDGIEQMNSMGALMDITVKESRTDKNDIKHAEITNISEFELQDTNIYGGCFLPDGQLLLCGNTSPRCIVCDEKGSIKQEVQLPGAPWDVLVESDGRIIVTIPGSKSIVVLLPETLAIEKTVKLKCECRGISKWNDRYMIGTHRSIEEFSLSFHHIRSRSVDITDDIVVDPKGNIIYAANGNGTVTKEDKDNNVVFTYTHAKLREPYGLALHEHGTIFVNGNDSNNIHILSEDGELLRTLGFQNPTCIKFEKDCWRFFVVSGTRIVNIFEIW